MSGPGSTRSVAVPVRSSPSDHQVFGIRNRRAYRPSASLAAGGDSFAAGPLAAGGDSVAAGPLADGAAPVAAGPLGVAPAHATTARHTGARKASRPIMARRRPGP